MERLELDWFQTSALLNISYLIMAKLLIPFVLINSLMQIINAPDVVIIRIKEMNILEEYLKHSKQNVSYFPSASSPPSLFSSLNPLSYSLFLLLFLCFFLPLLLFLLQNFKKLYILKCHFNVTK